MSTLEHRTLSSAISARIRQEILDGTHEAGAQLRQDALAAAFGVSRIPVREALFQLEAEGLVQIVPHKGAVVAPISLAEINDVFDLRLMLETRLLAAAAPRLGPEDLGKLESLQNRFVEAVARQDVRHWGEINAAFHLALYAPADLPRSLHIVAGLLQTSDRYTRLQLSTKRAMRRACEEHARLVTLCRAGQVAEAGALLHAHIEQVRQDLVALLQARQGAAAQRD